MSEIETVHVVVEGRVQGVGYRAWCADAAVSRGLSGWVRNRKTGAVEAVLSGPSDAVSDMLQHLWRGPTFARVRAVTQTRQDAAPDGDFEVRETA
ncbi:acylphosphatase [Roseibium sp. MMSF_3412]|uniref:acylphosphatase n=1 Tax=Roseibium sp. MMSF_3412 TaxID=3046712 RepID=UPI00273EE2F2|nr:acylphosphatase [Roseibium sp. MMSF_3412]